MEVTIRYTVSESYGSTITTSKTLDVPTSTREYDDPYPPPYRERGYGRAAVLLREEAEKLLDEAVERLRAEHEADCRRVDAANMRRQDEETSA